MSIQYDGINCVLIDDNNGIIHDFEGPNKYMGDFPDSAVDIFHLSWCSLFRNFDKKLDVPVKRKSMKVHTHSQQATIILITINKMQAYTQMSEMVVQSVGGEWLALCVYVVRHSRTFLRRFQHNSNMNAHMKMQIIVITIIIILICE